MIMTTPSTPIASSITPTPTQSAPQLPFTSAHRKETSLTTQRSDPAQLNRESSNASALSVDGSPAATPGASVGRRRKSGGVRGASGGSGDMRKESPEEYLKKLTRTVGKKERAKLLAQKWVAVDEFMTTVRNLAVSQYQFAGLAIDSALRQFLNGFLLPNESQEIDRVLKSFANKYAADNPGLFPDPDEAHGLSFAIVLLNTDQHNPNSKRRMTAQQFINNARPVCPAISPEILEIIHENIRAEPLQYAKDDMDPVNGNLMLMQQKGWRGRIGLNVNLKEVESRKVGGVGGDGEEEGKITSLPSLPSLEPAEDPILLISSSYPAKPIQHHNNSQTQSQINHPTLSSRPMSVASLATAMSIPFTSADINAPSSTTLPRMKRNDTTVSNASTTLTSTAPEHLITAILNPTRDGVLKRKRDVRKGGEKVKEGLRGWRTFWCVLSGSQLVLFRDVDWFLKKRGTPPPALPQPTTASTSNSGLPRRHSIYGEQIISQDFPSNSSSQTLKLPRPSAIHTTDNAITLYDPTYTGRDHVFRFKCGNGEELLFQAKDDDDARGWMDMLNFAATFKTVGVRARKGEKGLKGLAGRGGDVGGEEDRHTESDEIVDAEGRAAVIRMKLTAFENSLTGFEKQLALETTFQQHMRLLRPLTRKAKNLIAESTEEHRVQLRKLKVEVERLRCYKRLLEREVEEEGKWGVEEIDEEEEEEGGDGVLVNEEGIGGETIEVDMKSTVPPLDIQTFTESRTECFKPARSLHDKLFKTGGPPGRRMTSETAK
ncbi:hypothetical protein HK097_008837 [Rhizophlyctis rosea]|uniref:Uncharacterized protein n=1 Tax=Rhizophlyctis rosea TaxID=64517 RepID=A0AAD5SCJ6_9FUNG|nr:hypothetical protein HK097_008837 [Rhizophlyctis rosea]